MADTTKESPADNELDPELVKLPRAKTRIRPIMAMAIIGICLTIGLRLSSDLRFSQQGEALQVTSVGDLNAGHENQFVEIRLRPDRPQALRVVPSRATSGQVLMPVMGAAGAMWVLLPPTPWTADHATNDVYRGRLSRLADMDFHDALVAHVASGTIALRPIALEQVQTALSKSLMEVSDVSGDHFTVKATTEVQIQEVATEMVRVHAVSSDPYKDEASWVLALQNAGLLLEETSPISSTPNSWTFHVPAPDGLAAVSTKLRDSKLFAAEATEIRNTREGTWSELGLDGEDIVLGNPVSGFHTEQVAVASAPLVASDAFLLDTTEKPGTYWYVIIIVLGLAAIALLFAAALYQTLRRS